MMKFKVYLTILISFLLVMALQSAVSATGDVIKKKVDEEIRIRMLGPKPWGLMLQENLSELMQSPDSLERFVIAKREVHKEYEWYFIVIGLVQILMLLVLAVVCNKVVIGIVRRHEQ